MYKQDIELDSAKISVDGNSEISRTCNQCSQCKKECNFLQTYGNPFEIIEAKGLAVTQMQHSKEKTYCCGEGGAVGCMAPGLSQSWTDKRAFKSSSHKIVTYCAGLAFLISRYIPSEFFQSRLNSPKWIRLQNNVGHHGWKVVAMARLIPVLPFNLLNYASGLTRVKFVHYINATFIFMMPACIAFIVFSSSLPDLLKGQVSRKFVIGLVFILLTATLPIFRKKSAKGKSGYNDTTLTHKKEN